jgi:hypothetical protein
VKFYRHGYAPEFFLFVAALPLLLAAAILILAPPGWWELGVIPAHLALSAFWWRVSRMGARIERDGVKVVRMFRTIRIPWSQFHRFVLRPKTRGELVAIDKAGYVERSDGSLEWIQGLAPWGPVIRNDEFGVEALVIEMNRRAQEIKGRQDLAPSE